MDSQPSQNANLKVPGRSARPPMITLPTATSSASLQGLLGAMTPGGPNTPRTLNSVNERSKFLGGGGEGQRYGSVDDTAGSRESFSALHPHTRVEAVTRP